MPRILLVNPPIYDFSAFDFWLRPYGLLRIGGYLRNRSEIRLFDFLDRTHPSVGGNEGTRSDQWQRGRFRSEIVAKPTVFREVPRRYRRYGLGRRVFTDFLREEGPFDFALVQTTMTYWYPGVVEVLETLRQCSPSTKTVLGGVYASICPEHAARLGADLVVCGTDLQQLWGFVGLPPDFSQPPLWEAYSFNRVGVLKLADGCPFKCSYCSVPRIYPRFSRRPLETCIRELEFMAENGISEVVFFDDALLFRKEEGLVPFLLEVLRRGFRLNFHTPNALNARFVDSETARLMLVAGFKSIYLGFESAASGWQRETGGKVHSEELAKAAGNLFDAGAMVSNLTAYLILGHPRMEAQQLEESMLFVHGLGLRLMLSEFSPIPGTSDGEYCRKWVDLEEPLLHNKTAFTYLRLGTREVQRWKDLCVSLNRNLKACGRQNATSDGNPSYNRGGLIPIN